ncbi:MAG: LysE family translocator [Pseudomonadota bacterium]
MESSLTFASIAALSGVMVVGAMIPGVSVLAVSARSAAFGFAHGIFTSLGIVVGDIVFILVAIYGLSVLADLMGNHFVLIKYLGGAYLIWLGIVIWRSKSKAEGVEENSESSLLSSFMTGLLITLGDQKAILFYLGFFPAFVDLSKMSFFDTGIIVAIAIIAVGGPKLVYAFMADRASLIFKSSRVTRFINIAAGSVMIAVGVFVMVKA